MISKKILLEYNAKLKPYDKNEMVFKVNDIPRYYFQIEIGEVKLFNMNKDGKEYTHFIYSENRGIGEAALVGEFNYPLNCKTTENSIIWQLPRIRFFELLRNNQELHFKMSKTMAEQLFFKAIISKEISIEKAEHKIISLLDYLKHKVYNIHVPFGYKVELSRQQIADLVGLRVETVIRTIQKLKNDKQIIIKNRKIYR